MVVPSINAVNQPTSLYWSELKNRLQPLDILFFRGADFISDAIRIFERYEAGDGEFSHVGIVINSELLPTVPQLVPGRWYVWESTATFKWVTDGVPNIETGESKFGVQIRDLEEVVIAYTNHGKGRGRVAWGRLISNPWERHPDEGYLAYWTRHRKLIRDTGDLHTKYGNRTYDANFLNLFASLLPCLRTPRDVLHEILVDGHRWWVSHLGMVSPDDEGIAGWLFCSELVTLVLQTVGVLSKDIDYRNVVPVDFLVGITQERHEIPRVVQDPIYIYPDPARTVMKTDGTPDHLKDVESILFASLEFQPEISHDRPTLRKFTLDQTSGEATPISRCG